MARDAEFTLHVGGLHATKKELVDLAEVIARSIRNEIQDTMEEAPARTGHVYLVPGTKTKYTASAPGEPPAIREGRYLGSWQVTKGVLMPTGAFAAAFSDLTTEDGIPIGLLLEEGTHDLVNYRVRMEPRPHIRPALESVQPRVQRILKNLGRV